MLEQVQALKDRVEDIFLPRLTVVELIEALGRILEYQPAPSPFREDGIWPHLSAGSHSAE